MAGIKFFLFVIALQWTPSLLLPLAQQDVALNNNKSLVMETNQTERINPNNSKATDLIQQIDVKDNANKVISNINHVAISDEPIVKTPSKKNEDNGSSNLVVNNATVVTKEDSHNTGVTNALKDENITVLEHQNTLNNGTQSNASSKNLPSLNTNLSSDNFSRPDITTFTNLVEEISSAEAPAFRSLMPDKIRKRQLSKAISTTAEPTTEKDHNLVLKLIPNSPPITIDLNQIPLNNLFGEAFSFMKRFKRNTPDTDISVKKINGKSMPIEKHHDIGACNKTISNNDLNATSLTPTRKFLSERIFDVQELYDTVELVCPLSVIVKLYSHQVLSKLVKNDLHNILNQILSSFMKGEEDAITVFSKELSELPLKLKLRLQLVHGKTKEFLQQLDNTVDATLCSVS